jgi:hypothetical protein
VRGARRVVQWTGVAVALTGRVVPWSRRDPEVGRSPSRASSRPAHAGARPRRDALRDEGGACGVTPRGGRPRPFGPFCCMILASQFDHQFVIESVSFAQNTFFDRGGDSRVVK